MNSEKKFKNGKIYSIRCTTNEELIYIGSTCQPLYKRIYDHKAAAKGNYFKNMLLYVKMNELGPDKFYIELIMNYPCKNREELNKIEGEYIRKLSTLNKNMAGRTITDSKYEYRIKNKEEIEQRRTQPFICECGCTIKIRNKKAHQSTKNHFKSMEEKQMINDLILGFLRGFKNTE